VIFPLLSLVFTSGLAIYAQTPRSLVPEDPWSAFYLSGVGPDSRTFINVEGQPFRRAVQLRTPASTAVNPWDIRIVYQPEYRVLKGDTLLASFWIRTIEPRNSRAYTRFVVERASDPYTKSAEWHLSAGPEWRRVDVPFTMVEDAESRSWTVQFWVSSGPQTIEIGGLSVYNYGQRYPIASLQLPSYPYEGSGEDAQWRRDAEQRIEKHRKTDIVVVLRDDQGNPVPQSAVRVNLKKHDFGFGTAVAHALLKASTADGERYREALRQWFNKTVLENELKWPDWESNRARAQESLDILNSLQIGAVRGHTLVWPGLQYLPNDIRTLLNNPEQLRSRVANRVSEGAAAVRGQVTEWDVVNEAITNRDLQRVLGDAELVRWFRLARTADPQAKLYINDYSIISSGGDDLPQQNAYIELIRYLTRQGAPLDGIGIQAHFDQQLTPPERIIEILDRFATLGKELQITEFDVDAADEALQAAYTRDFLIAAFSHPAVRGVLTWGFWEGSHWRPNAAMIRKDWRWKPNGEAWRELIFTRWWTDARGITGDDGVFRARGFRGEYDITVTMNGQTKTVTANLSGSGPQYVRIGRARPAAINSGGVVNAASLVSGPVAPGQMITVLGTGFGPRESVTTTAGEDRRLPVGSADTQVFVDGTPSPVVSAAPGQVTAILPYTLGVTTDIEVDYQGVRSNRLRLPVAETAPGIFTTEQGVGQAVALNYDSEGLTEINSVEKPATTGSIVGIFITGEGRLQSTIAAGQLPDPENPASPVQAVSVRIGSVEGRLLSARLIQPGVTEVKVEIPRRAPLGDAVPVAINVSGIWSQTGATIAIR